MFSFVIKNDGPVFTHIGPIINPNFGLRVVCRDTTSPDGFANQSLVKEQSVVNLPILKPVVPEIEIAPANTTAIETSEPI